MHRPVVTRFGTETAQRYTDYDRPPSICASFLANDTRGRRSRYYSSDKCPGGKRKRVEKEQGQHPESRF